MGLLRRRFVRSVKAPAGLVGVGCATAALGCCCCCCCCCGGGDDDDDDDGDDCVLGFGLFGGPALASAGQAPEELWEELLQEARALAETSTASPLPPPPPPPPPMCSST